MPLTTMLNKLPKVCLSTEKMLNCVRLRLMHQFIIMVLKQKVMTLSLVIFFVQQLVQPSQFISRGQDLGQFHIPTFGRHNIMNATAVIGLLYTAGFDLNLVREHLKTFAGVKRRFTEKIVNDTGDYR